MHFVRNTGSYLQRLLLDDDICAAVPDLVGFLAVPTPTQNIGSRLRWYLDFIHEAEALLRFTITGHLAGAASTVLPAHWKHGACWTMFVASALRVVGNTSTRWQALEMPVHLCSKFLLTTSATDVAVATWHGNR